MLLAVVFGGIAVKNISGQIFGDGEPLLFYGKLDNELLGDYKDVLGIAHNAGDSARTTRLALDHNADVIEIDVVSSATTLYAGHAPPPEFAPPAGRVTTLTSAWGASFEEAGIMLDLKNSSRSFLLRLASFLHSRPSDGVIVVSRSTSALRFLDEAVPGARLMLSVITNSSLTRVLEDDELASMIDGVSVASGVLDDDNIAELKGRDLLVFAWVVNRIGRVNELVAAGVDGIVTDNLALLELFGDTEEAEPTAEGLVAE